MDNPFEPVSFLQYRIRTETEYLEKITKEADSMRRQLNSKEEFIEVLRNNIKSMEKELDELLKKGAAE